MDDSERTKQKNPAEQQLSTDLHGMNFSVLATQVRQQKESFQASYSVECEREVKIALSGLSFG